MAPTRIGILGGTFDPIHLGHLVPAEYACGHLGLDRLYLVPSAAPVHRPRHTPASPEHRLRMCELAAEPIPPFAVSDCEIRRTEPSYTILTIEHFAQTLAPNATIFLLLGEDNLPLLHTWHRIADIVALATLAILPRPIGCHPERAQRVEGSRRDALPPAADHPPQSVIPSAAEACPERPERAERESRRDALPPAADHPPQSVIPSAAEGSRRDALPSAVQSEIRNLKSAIRIPSPLVPISSTDIRRRIRDGRSIAGLVPASVADYIARHGLYKARR